VNLLLYLSQFNAQYFCKLSSYFNQVLCDFGPHQTIQLFKFLFPFPPLNKGDFGSSWSDPFEQSKRKWMLLALFLVVLLTELAASPG
jgi:hypothetical protein